MVSILLSIIVGVIAFFAGKTIRNQFNIILVITVILSAVTFFIDLEITTQGYLGLAFFIIVMFAGAFTKGSKPYKRFKAVRKEYSILGFVILLPHAIKYLLQFLDGSYPVEWFGVIAYAVMLPLFIISFTYFKKKMDIKKWVQYQKWAYLAYALTFIHLLLIGQAEHILAYIVVFNVYLFLKLYNYVFKNNETTSKTVKSIGITGVVVIISLLVSGTISLPEKHGEDFDTNNTNTISVSTDTGNIEDGTYRGSSTGFNNLTVSLDVVVEDGLITNIIVYEYGATSPQRGVDFEAAGYDVVIDIINAQSTDVDTISGATYTTNGIIEAVEDALS